MLGAGRYRIRVTRAPISLPGRTVIFDFGEVISLTPSAADRAAIARLAEVDGDAEKFWQAYSAHRDGLDQGSAGAIAYWQAIADDLGAAWDEARMHELWAADFRSWLSINPAVIEVLSDLRAGGTRLALLSNAGPDYGSYFRHGPLGDFFEACYVSGELGLIKPHPEIFLHVLADLSITPAEAVFIDNRDSNVAGAEALGITGHVFTTADALRSFLTSTALPSVSPVQCPDATLHRSAALLCMTSGCRRGTYPYGPLPMGERPLLAVIIQGLGTGLWLAREDFRRVDGGDGAVGPDDDDPGRADGERARPDGRLGRSAGIGCDGAWCAELGWRLAEPV